MNTTTPETTVLIDEQRVEAPGGVLYAVRRLGLQRIAGVNSSQRLEVRMSDDAGQQWADVPLRACPAHVLRASASAWPPPAALSVAVDDEGALVIEFDNVFDPWEKATPTRQQAHARWQARYDARWRWWSLQQLRLHGPDEPATR